MKAQQDHSIYACSHLSWKPTYSKENKHGCGDIEGIVVRPVVFDQQVLGPVCAVLELLYQARVLTQVEVWHWQHLQQAHALVGSVTGKDGLSLAKTGQQ